MENAELSLCGGGSSDWQEKHGDILTVLSSDWLTLCQKNGSLNTAWT